jgi:hypothetical protein
MTHMGSPAWAATLVVQEPSGQRLERRSACGTAYTLVFYRQCSLRRPLVDLCATADLRLSLADLTRHPAPGVEPLPDPVPLTEEVEHAFLDRYRRLPAATQALLYSSRTELARAQITTTAWASCARAEWTTESGVACSSSDTLLPS